MTLSSGLMQSYSIESAKVPVKKHSSSKISSHRPLQVAPMKVFNGKSKVKTNVRKREQIDNVRGELIPKSREDINNIKRISYHGKNSPMADALVGVITQTTTKPIILKKSKKPTKNRVDRVYVTTKKFKPSPKIPNSSEKFQAILPSKKFEKPVYVPNDTPFYPLMRPSPINVLPTDPPSFDTVRNYVRYLKMRNEKNYADIHSDEDDDDDDKPSALALSHHQPAQKKTFDGEIDYFKAREKQLVEEQKSEHNQFSPTSSSTESSDDKNEPNKDDYANASHSRDNYDDDESSQDYSDADHEESRNREKNFVPFKLYAQVRHVESEGYEPDEHDEHDGKVKEKITLEKKNVYYKEEGHDDEAHKHSSEDVKYKRKNHHKKEKKGRSKRSVEDLPVALAYIKKTELPSLTGEKLLRHIDELIRNSSVFLPDEDDVERPIKIVPARQSRVASKHKKFPYYNLSENVLSQMSAHRYSENLHAYPRQKESLYTSKNTKQCQDIEDGIVLDKEGDESGEGADKKPPPRRLQGLGGKIECLKLKYFGKNPFDNPLFKEDEYVTATIPLPVNHSNVISRQANPLINVYDDVIRTIRAENYAEEKQKNLETVNDSVKLASENVPVRATTGIVAARIPNYSSVVGVSQLPIFDINKFLPKFKPMATINDDDDDIDITKLLYGGKKNATHSINNKEVKPITSTSQKIINRPNSINVSSIKSDASSSSSSTSHVEKPKVVKRNYKSKPSSNVNERVPGSNNNKKQITIQKFRRGAPLKTVTISSHSRPTRNSSYRFKLL